MNVKYDKFKNIKRNIFKGKNIGYLFVLPTIVFLLIIMIFPLGYAAYISFFEVLTHMEKRFVGFANYLNALTSISFWNSLYVTLFFTVISVIIHMIIGFYLASMLSTKVKGSNIFRFLLLIPWMVSQVVTGVIWRWILNAQYGVGNDILVNLGVIDKYLPWLAETTLAKISIITAYSWQCLPFVMIMLYAGMQTIPVQQYEAAKIDGASKFQRMIYVTIPNLKHVILVTSLMDFIWAFRCFDLPQIMTNGGPYRSTELLSIYIYKNTFEYFKFGYASAVSILMLLMVLTFSILYTNKMLSGDLNE